MRGHLISIKVQRAKYVAADWITSMLGVLLFDVFRYFILNVDATGDSILEYLCGSKLILEQMLLPVAMLGIFWMSGYYNHPFGKSRLVEFSTTLFSTLTNTVWIYLSLLINDQVYGRAISYELITVLFLCLFTFTYAGRLTITQQAIRHFRKGKWSFNTVMAGDSEAAMAVAGRLGNSQSRLGYGILAHLPLAGEQSSTLPHQTISFDRLKELCANGEVDQILIAPEVADEKRILYLIYDFLPLGVPIRLTPTSLSILSNNIRMQDVYAEPFVDVTSPGITEFTKNLKRTLDVVLSAIALIILTPLLLATAIAVKVSSKGPVIYKQERIGYHQKPFNIYKFRSMVCDAEADGPRLSDDDDPRITPVGRFMRKYRVDELPQFWNVLRGDMSLVGPRPERRYFISKIVEKAPYYTLLHQVRPGITSWGMVKFGYAKSVDEMVERTRYDLIYLANMSVTVDFKIMIHTINTVFSGKGV